MTTSSLRHPLFAGLALILVVNAVALMGAAYNRSGEPESTLTLSQRELRLSGESWDKKENSGVALNLQWRVPVAESEEAALQGYASYGRVPEWLDKRKLAVLGFDLSVTASDESRHSQRLQSKEVFLVLELDGMAYQQALERTRSSLAKQDNLSVANPGNKEFEQRLKMGKERLAREENEESRLFAIDAGLEVQGLRAKYADRKRFMIVRARIRPQLLSYGKDQKSGGYIEGLSISQINVPVDFQRGLVRARTSLAARSEATTAFAVVVAFGKRLEPWVMALTEK